MTQNEYVTQRTRIAGTIGAAWGVVVALVAAGVTVGSLYANVSAKVDAAQNAANLANANIDGLKADTEKRIAELRADIHEMHADVKTILMRKQSP